MTGIIWTLYLADVVGSLAIACGVGGFAAFASAGIGKFATAIENQPTPTWLKSALIVGASLWAVSVLLPSKTTLYAIAATNAGETALKTETGDKALRALNAWLDRQIAGEDEKK